MPTVDKNYPTSENTFKEADIQQWQEENEILPDGIENQPIHEESITEKYAKSQLRVVRETKDFTLDYLSHALKKDSFIINVAPEYQRRQRWSQKKRSQLIESFYPIFLLLYLLTTSGLKSLVTHSHIKPELLPCL